jgi:catechol 2,3-dioxygenase-like lactoylglutathione lyase family enzyme
MIIATHSVLFSPEADKVRAFFRDVLDLPSVDAGGGWLIFKLPPSELGVHPSGSETSHELYLVCDDLDTTMADLAGKGVEFDGDVEEAGFGRVATIRLPGGGRLGMYQPHHPLAAT